MSHEAPDIPDMIRAVVPDEEIENMQNLDGWAVGHITECVENVVIRQIEDAWIELFNGEGCAGEFGGVRFMGKNDEGRYEEAYAYGSKEAAERNNDDTCFYVRVFTHPKDPNVGEPAPTGEVN